MNMRKRIAAGIATAGIAAAALGGIASAGTADASAPVVSATTRVKYLTSATCTVTKTHTVTYMHWSSTAGRYVPYSVPRVTNTTATACHS